MLRIRGVSIAAKLARRVGGRVRHWMNPFSFRIWRWGSLRRYGPVRPIQYRGHRFVVLSNDWRAFWLATSSDVNPKTRKKVCALLELNPSLYVDVGANYGEFVAEAVARGIRTVAIEPNPELVACLQRTFGVDERVTILNEAAADMPDGEVLLATKPGLSGYSSLTPSVLEGKDGPAAIKERISFVSVRCRTLSSMLEGNVALPSVVIKVDVEGHEIEVLRGAVEMLGRVENWWAVLVEFDPEFLERRGLNVDREFQILRALAPAFGEYVDGKIVWRPSDAETVPRKHTDLILGSAAFLKRTVAA